jgi:penicillin-binding protein 1A
VSGNGRQRNGNGNGNGNGHYPGQRRRVRQRRRRERSTTRRAAVLLTLVLLVGGVAAIGAGALTGASAFGSSCDLNSLRPVAIGQNSFVYAADGSLLGAIPAERNRQPLKLDQMSKWITTASVAIEDRRFYEHQGLDFEGILRAFVKNVESGGIVEGGSTITQQLVRNLYIGSERSYKRKAKEACLALKLDRVWSKDRILQTYLNQIYFGNHAYGVEAASQTYFSKPAGDLGLAQSALIAGLPQAPSVYDPFQRPDEAVRRRNDVLRAMLAARYITQAQYNDAVARPLKLKAGRLYTRIREPYFFSYVREQLIAKYGASKVRSGGLRIYTTIDPRFQRLARTAMKDTLYERSDPASAIVSINPKNGAIRAMTSQIPGRRGVQFNLAAQGRRQAGSSFKTFVLVEAIKNGVNPDSTYYVSAPFHWQPDPLSEPWDVKTYDDSYVGTTSITGATLRSDNTIYARLTLDLGPEKVAKTAREMGIKTKLQPVASIGLGSNSVSVLEMASAYATLAAGGVYSEPMAIRKVVLPNGRVDAEAGWGRPKQRRVLDDGVAYEVTRVLEQNMVAGTGTGAYFGRPSAGKTGTTDNFADAWFCGYTPTLATAVWVGYPNAQIEMRSVHGISVAGGTFPATIWNLFMSAALSPTPSTDWTLPETPAVWSSFSGQYQVQALPPPPPVEETTTEETESGETETGVPEPPPVEPPPVEPPPVEPPPVEPPPVEPPPVEPPPATTPADPAAPDG